VDASTSDNQEHKQSFQGVVEVLAAELFNPAASQNVRKNVQTCLGFLAKRWGTEVSELLEPLHAPLLNMLVGRPLRAKHTEAQASNAEGI
jgi:transformation/transcription domain-associated protein